MKSASIKEIKDALQSKSPKELVAICLSLSKYKKDNKDYLSYLLYESEDKIDYLQQCKEEMDAAIDAMSYKTFYHKKNAIRALLKKAKTRIRYTSDKEIELELLMHFCKSITDLPAEVSNNHTVMSIVERQIIIIKKTIAKMHEDLQYDYLQSLDELGF